VSQSVFHVATREKTSLLLGLLHRDQPTSAMIFVNTKRAGERLAWRLHGNGIHAAYMSGDLPQNKRLRIIEAFKAGEIRYLIATDVASRGIHVNDLSHVFNYDVPNDPESYVHRIGRTGRAGASGIAYTLACEDFVMNLPHVEALIKYKIDVEFADDEHFIPDRSGRYFSKPGITFVGWPADNPEITGGRPRPKKGRR
jgi:ATP-dependent RNA helicase RhlB